MSWNNDQERQKFFSLDIIGEKIIYKKKKIEILDYLKLNPRGYFNLTYLAILYENYHLLPIRQRNRFIIRFQLIPKQNKRANASFQYFDWNIWKLYFLLKNKKVFTLWWSSIQKKEFMHYKIWDYKGAFNPQKRIFDYWGVKNFKTNILFP